MENDEHPTKIEDNKKYSNKAIRKSKSAKVLFVLANKKKIAVAQKGLVESSLYFEVLLRHDFLESKKCEIVMKYYDSEAFICLLDFICNNRQNKFQSNILCDLLKLSDLMGLTKLRAYLSHKLESQLSKENCLDVLQFTLFRNMEDLSLTTIKYILNNFHFINQATCKPNWTESLLKMLLTAQHLRYIHRSTLIRYFKYWIVVDENRRNLLHRVIKDIVLKEPCKPSTMDLLEDLASMYEHDRCLVTLDKKDKLSLLILGGHSGNKSYSDNFIAHNEFHKDVKSGYSTEKCIPIMIHIRVNFASTKDCNGVYVIGGIGTTRNPLSSVEYYDFDENRWSEKPSLNEPREFCAAASKNSIIYASGGRTSDSEILRTVCILVSKRNVWKSVASMAFVRMSHQMCTVNELIYALGGRNESNVLASIEVYDTFANVWTTLTPMQYARQRFGVAVVDEYIFVFGGVDICGNSIEPVERYDTLNDSWEVIANYRGMYDMGVAVFDKIIYICGGYIGKHPQSLIIRLNAETYALKIIGLLKIRRHGLAAFVFPNNEFLHAQLVDNINKGSMNVDTLRNKTEKTSYENIINFSELKKKRFLFEDTSLE